MRIIIIGAGIGGLSAANALARAGHEVTLLERTTGFDAVGAGIVLGPNAVQVLHSLGVDLAGEGTTLASADMRTADGRLLTRLDIRGLGERVGPTIGIERPRLHTVLAEALPEDVEIVLGHAVESVRERHDGVEVQGNGVTYQADLVIGADGLRSSVRSQAVDPSVPLRYSGTTCWRGVVDLDLGHTTVEAWGGRSRVGAVPVGDRRTYYYLVLTTPPEQPGPPDLTRFRALFPGFRGTAGELVDSLTTVPDLHHDLNELDHPVWGTPRVLLLGDAAHGITPNQGQGAAMAIEDALAVALALRPGVSGALERYRDLRHSRVRGVQLTSRRIGVAAHWHNPLATRLRDLTMRSTPRTARARALRSLVAPGIELAAAAGVSS